MAEDFKLKWSNLRPSNKVTLIAAFIGLIGSLTGTILSINKAQEANAFVQKEFAIKYTPDIRTYIVSWNIYVGEGRPFRRDDNIIVIPMAICNKSYGLAKDINLKIIYNDGTWELDKEFVFSISPKYLSYLRQFFLQIFFMNYFNSSSYIFSIKSSSNCKYCPH